VALFIVGIVVFVTPGSVLGVMVLGDTNVEPVTTTLGPANYVMALTKITVTQPTTIRSVSIYLQYTGSDGSQCIKFGIYGDNGASYGQSSPINESLIAATVNGYCFQAGDFGPAWETWTLLPWDTLTISTPGTYWLTTLTKEGYGNAYHFTYTGAYGGQFLYKYGYFYYGFPASFTLGYPPTIFGNMTYSNANLIQPFNQFNIGEYNAPFSFYVTGT
jgi:hypothetical protein